MSPRPPKTGEKPGQKPGALVKQAHGGALRNGSTPGSNKPGPGRPRSEVRHAFVGLVNELGASLIRDIATGKPVQTTRVAIGAILPFIVCGKCGESHIKTRNPDDAEFEITVETSASPRDRLAAMEQAAKYGLGALKETTVEDVSDRLNRTLDILQAQLDPELFATVVKLIEPEWR